MEVQNILANIFYFLLHDLISQKQKVAMFSVDPFSVQRGLCALTKYNGSTDSTNSTTRNIDCARIPWCVDWCTQSVLCRLVKCHAAPEHIFNKATVHVKTGVCVSVSVLTEQFTTDLCQCVSPHRAVHNRSVSVCQSSPSSSQQICISVSVFTEQFTTNLYQCVSPHRTFHNRSVSVTA